MYNYQKKYFALNKKAAGIVYYSTQENKTWEITAEDYIAENPHEEERHFLRWKRLSNAIYLRHDRAYYAQTKKCVSIHGMEDFITSGDLQIDEQLIETQEYMAAARAIDQLYLSSSFTEIERRRSILYYCEGLSVSKIAESEGVTARSVYESITSSTKKLCKIYVKS